jgi:hypothetical protein
MVRKEIKRTITDSRGVEICYKPNGAKRADVNALIGSVFDQVTILGEAEDYLSIKGNLSGVMVRCSCGNESRRKLSDIFHLHRSSQPVRCERCGSDATKTGGRFLTGSWFNSVRHGAKVRGFSFEITIGDCENQWHKQQGLCAFTGILLDHPEKIKLSEDKYWYKGNGSLDRINSKLGYTKENIQWVHKVINRIKLDTGNELFIKICNAIAEKNKRDSSLLWIELILDDDN